MALTSIFLTEIDNILDAYSSWYDRTIFHLRYARSSRWVLYVKKDHVDKVKKIVGISSPCADTAEYHLSLTLLQDKNFDNYKKKDEERRKFTRAQTMIARVVLWLYNRILMDIYSVEL